MCLVRNVHRWNLGHGSGCGRVYARVEWIKSSRLLPSAHCISTLFGGNDKSKLRGEKQRKGTYFAVWVLSDRRRRIGLFLTMHGALVSVKSKKEEKRAYLLVSNDVRVM